MLERREDINIARSIILNLVETSLILRYFANSSSDYKISQDRGSFFLAGTLQSLSVSIIVRKTNIATV